MSTDTSKWTNRLDESTGKWHSYYFNTETRAYDVPASHTPETRSNTSRKDTTMTTTGSAGQRIEPLDVDKRVEAPEWVYRARDDEFEARSNIHGLHHAGHLTDHAAERADTLMTSITGDDRPHTLRWAEATSDPNYLRAWGKLMATGEHDVARLSDRERAAVERVDTMRGIVLGTGAGDYPVPLSVEPAVVPDLDGAHTALLDAVNTIRTTDTEARVSSSASNTAEWLAQATEGTDQAPTLAETTIRTHKATSTIPYSVEIGEDASELADRLGQLIRESITELLARAVLVGTGTGEPTGLVTALDGTSSEVAPGGTTLADDDIRALSGALPGGHRVNGRWLATSTDISNVDALETSGGQRAFAELGNGRLLGLPVTPVDDAADGNLIVGDIARAYTLVQRLGTTVEKVQHLPGANQRPSGQRALWAYARIGGNLVAPNAVRMLQIP